MTFGQRGRLAILFGTERIGKRTIAVRAGAERRNDRAQDGCSGQNLRAKHRPPHNRSGHAGMTGSPLAEAIADFFVACEQQKFCF
jgi:hypothetical protein